MAQKVLFMLLALDHSKLSTSGHEAPGTPPLYFGSPISNPKQIKLNLAPKERGSLPLPAVDPSFPGYACEERSLLFYAGMNGKQNQFSRNLINEVSKRTNTRPSIRVGGTSLDHSRYDPSQKEAAIIPEDQENLNVPRNVSYGPSYFDSFATFSDALYTFDVPLATKNLSATVAFAKEGYKRIGADNIEQLEVGNEPSVYPTEDRSPDYSPEDYVRQWKKYTSAVSKAVGIESKAPVYQAIGLYGSPGLVPINPYGRQWDVKPLFVDAGLDTLISRISSVSLHYYQTQSLDDSNLQRDLMNHTGVKIKLDYYNKHYIRFAASRGLPTNLAEVGSAYNNGFNNYALESVLGSCLWQVDFMLYAMSIGVKRVNMQQGIAFGFALWQPVHYKGRPAAVAPTYYAQLLAADFIGTDGSVHVSNIDLDSDIMSAYAAYDSETGELKRAVIVNLEFWSSLYSTNARPSVKVGLSVPPQTTQVVVQYLTSPFGATASDSLNITWAGQSWSHDSNGLGVPSASIANDTRVLEAHHGLVNVRVNASQAAMLFFN